jgi:DNA-binding NarL/FixJ family response regulator
MSQCREWAASKATQIINETSPAIRILLLTLHKSTELLRASFSASVIGYVLKSDGEDELIGALETVNRGEIYVTRAISPSVVVNIVKRHKTSLRSYVVMPYGKKRNNVLASGGGA